MSELVKQDLILSLMSGESDRLQGHLGEFNIWLTLTDKGVDNIDEILRMLFAYINKLKEDKPQEYSFEERRRISLL